MSDKLQLVVVIQFKAINQRIRLPEHSDKTDAYRTFDHDHRHRCRQQKQRNREEGEVALALLC